MKLKTKYGDIPVEISSDVPKDVVYLTNTYNWYRNDNYQATLKCKNRLVTAIRALFKGVVKLEWTVPSNKKDKRLHITGEK